MAEHQNQSCGDNSGLRIKKYDLFDPATPVDCVELDMMSPAHIIRIGTQHGLVKLWAMTGIEQNTAKARFYIFDDEVTLPRCPQGMHLVYIGTVWVNDERRALHIFHLTPCQNHRG